MKSHLFHLIAVFLLGTIILVGYGFWYAAIANKSSAVVDLQNQIASKKEIMNRAASARAALAKIAGAKDAMQSFFIPETGVVAFIDGLEAQGKSLGTVVSVLSVSTGSTGTQPTFILSLTIRGSFNAVMRTVGVIEYAPYDLSVSEFSLTQDDKKNWRAALNFSVGSVHAATSTPL